MKGTRRGFIAGLIAGLAISGRAKQRQLLAEVEQAPAMSGLAIPGQHLGELRWFLRGKMLPRVELVQLEAPAGIVDFAVLGRS